MIAEKQNSDGLLHERTPKKFVPFRVRGSFRLSLVRAGPLNMTSVVGKASTDEKSSQYPSTLHPVSNHSRDKPWLLYHQER